jgi:hypothetical protein
VAWCEVFLPAYSRLADSSGILLGNSGTLVLGVFYLRGGVWHFQKEKARARSTKRASFIKLALLYGASGILRWTQ